LKEEKQKKLVRNPDIVLEEFAEMEKSGVVIDKEAQAEVDRWVNKPQQRSRTK